VKRVRKFKYKKIKTFKTKLKIYLKFRMKIKTMKQYIMKIVLPTNLPENLNFLKTTN